MDKHSKKKDQEVLADGEPNIANSEENLVKKSTQESVTKECTQLSSDTFEFSKSQTQILNPKTPGVNPKNDVGIFVLQNID